MPVFIDGSKFRTRHAHIELGSAVVALVGGDWRASLLAASGENGANSRARHAHVALCSAVVALVGADVYVS